MFIVPITGMAPMASILGDKQGAGQSGSGVQLPFADVFKDAVRNVEETKKVSDKDAYELAMGKTDNLPAVMINSVRASTAVELCVQLTGRAVSAYKEIMQTQV